MLNHYPHMIVRGILLGDILAFCIFPFVSSPVFTAIVCLFLIPTNLIGVILLMDL